MKKIMLVGSLIFIAALCNQNVLATVNNITVRPPATANSSYITPAAPNITAKAYILVDANSGAVLAEKNAEQRLAPASLTKLMSLYIIFKELADERIKLTDMVSISKEAWQTSGSRMFVQVNTQVKLEALLQGIIISSGNDATVALAEHIAGTQAAFTQFMEQQAQILGMSNTHYTDPTGLPDKEHYSTAKDFAILSTALIRDFPQYYHYFSEKWFTYNKIRQPNRNNLLWTNFGVDGLKTGHTEAAGYCLIGSAKQNDMRLIAIVMGANSEKARSSATQALLQYGFRFFKTQKLYSANQRIATARVYSGVNKKLTLGSTQDIAVTLPINAAKNITSDIQIDNPLTAPIVKGQKAGSIIVKADNTLISTQPLFALEDNPRGGWWRSFIDWFAFLLHKIF